MAVEARINEYLTEMPKLLPKLHPNEFDDLMKHAIKAGTYSRLTAIKNSARSRLVVDENQLDRDANLLNCPNGIVDLKTGELRDHDREYRMTMVTNASYHEGAESSLWNGFLEDTIEDPDERLFLQRLVGYSLYGHQPEQVFAFLFGPGRTGKSSFIKAIAGALGSYHRWASFETFLLQRGSRDAASASPDLARLARARWVSAVEVGHGAHLDAGRIKSISGGDTITARVLYGSEQEFVPVLSLWLSANDRPKARVDDDALFRRLVPIHFRHQVPEEDVDATLEDRLRAPNHRSGVLAWAIAGAVSYAKVGLQKPASVRAGVEAYRRSANPLTEWLDEATQPLVNSVIRVRKSKAWNSYRGWCRENEERSIRKGEFRKIMDSIYVARVYQGTEYWEGVALVEVGGIGDGGKVRK
jgi:putative DNA primase/helicase